MLAVPRALLRSSAAAAALRVAAPRAVAGAPAAKPRARSFAAASKVVKTLSAEIKHEEEQYEQAKEIKAFLKKSDFKMVEKDGDVNMMLEKSLGGDRLVRIEWQLTSPFDP